MKASNSVLASVIGSLLATAATQAGAQTAETQQQTAEVGGLEEVIVTAQRREESLQRAAVPITAVTAANLTSAGVTDSDSLGRVVPSLIVAPTGGSGLTFSIRGVGTLQSNAFAENPIAFNFAGVYVGRPTAPIGSFYDIERVEVLKGPQGTLYGRNATGGAINVIPKAPELNSFGGEINVDAGNYSARRASAAVNLPLGPSFALRVAGQTSDRDGYLSDGYNDEEGRAARVSALWDPVNSWSMLTVLDYFHLGGKGAGGQLAPGSAFGNASGFAYPGYAAPSLEDRIGGADPASQAALAASPPPASMFLGNGFVAPPDRDGYNDSTFFGISSTITGEVGSHTLTIIPAYRHSEPDFRFYTVGFLGEVQEEVDQYSLEVRLASSSDQLISYVAGAYYYDEEQDASNRFYQGLISDTRFQPQLQTQSMAAFGQLTFNVSDTFRLVAGGRYTDETKSSDTATQLFGPAGLAAAERTRSEQDFSKVTWKAGVEADVGEDSLLYANVATGFKAGGFFVGAVDNTFAPEELTAYTIGTKNRFLDNQLQINAEAFYWKYEDQQISFVGPVQVVPGLFSAAGKTVNAGEATMKGAELEIQYAPTANWLLTANALYNDAEYDSLRYVAISAGGSPIRTGCTAAPDTSSPIQPPARLFQIDCAGQPGVMAPEFSGNVSAEYTFDLSSSLALRVGARSRYSSSYYLSVEYLPEQEQESFTMSDAYLTLMSNDERWSVSGYVNNIEDETVLAAATPRPVLQTVYVVTQAPRTYGLRASYRF